MLSEIKRHAVERMAVNYPNHLLEIANAFDEVIKESIKTSVEQIFLGSSVAELKEAKEMIISIHNTPAPISEPVTTPVVEPEPVTTPVVEPEPVTTPVVKDPKNSKKNKKPAADILG